MRIARSRRGSFRCSKRRRGLPFMGGRVFASAACAAFVYYSADRVPCSLSIVPSMFSCSTNLGRALLTNCSEHAYAVRTAFCMSCQPPAARDLSGVRPAIRLSGLLYALCSRAPHFHGPVLVAGMV
ncbi:hypothetical protein PENSPDRAFT_415270 [Peniophora sp. CONT]|nr:hypothetical protein PENSPDRAFT_415270 [Peniophora sp. CONT]